MGHLIEPHGGKLVDLYCPQDLADSLKKQSINYFSVDLNPRQMFDLELILNGGFSPLQGFMTQAEYESVVENAVLPNGQCWPIPVYLDVSGAVAEKISIDQPIALRDMEGFLLAILTVSDI